MQVNNHHTHSSWWENGRFPLNLTRLLWIITTLVLLTLFIAGLKPRYDELTTLCLQEPCLPLILTPPDAAALTDMGFSLHQYALFHVGLEVVLNSFIVLLACLIFWRKSDDWMALITAFTLVMFGLNFMVEADSAFVHSFPAWQVPFDIVTSFAGVSFAILFFLFPDGRFVPQWTRWFTIFLIFAALFDPLFRSLGLTIPSSQFSLVFLWLFLASLIVGVCAQIYRYRRVSTPTQRQQTKWVILGFASFFLAIFGWSIFLEIAPLPLGRPRVLFNIFFFLVVSPVFVFFPATMVISMMRYRLWDVDLLIRRTVTYGLVTALLAAVYLGGVILIQTIFRSLTGTSSQIAIVLSTLAIAALFNPLRTRIQAFIDRRFYRRKYDAQQVLADFAQTARDEVDMEALQTELLRVVQETMEPTNISLWLKNNGS
jgi:hypothetical protein